MDLELGLHMRSSVSLADLAGLSEWIELDKTGTEASVFYLDTSVRQVIAGLNDWLEGHTINVEGLDLVGFSSGKYLLELAQEALRDGRTGN